MSTTPDDFRVPSAEDHATEARAFLARAAQPGLAAEGSIAYGVQALAHALLAAHTPQDVRWLEPVEGKATAPVTPLGLLAVALLCAAAVAIVWIIAG